jgi:hypothetical protein
MGCVVRACAPPPPSLPIPSSPDSSIHTRHGVVAAAARLVGNFRVPACDAIARF